MARSCFLYVIATFRLDTSGRALLSAARFTLPSGYYFSQTTSASCERYLNTSATRCSESVERSLWVVILHGNCASHTPCAGMREHGRDPFRTTGAFKKTRRQLLGHRGLDTELAVSLSELNIN
ncbi:hypothetical protein A0H81_08583 [Grifola frondosa]|uniref:Uncharacterized protein n=1 Tax=Grifola frondosa TaxID=5627 RepID=A0A1C7M9K8_GRIFR|nr:hypothetical protein A0H81_08583 [Grifola frondosa]